MDRLRETVIGHAHGGAVVEDALQAGRRATWTVTLPLLALAATAALQAHATVVSPGG